MLAILVISSIGVNTEEGHLNGGATYVKTPRNLRMPPDFVKSLSFHGEFTELSPGLSLYLRCLAVHSAFRSVYCGLNSFYEVPLVWNG